MSGLGGVRLGLAPVNWNNDDVREWGQTRPYQELAAIAGRLGYDGLESGTGAPDDPAALRALLTEHGVRCCGAYRWLRLADPTAADREVEGAVRAAERLAAAGADTMLVAEHWTPARRAVSGRAGEHPELALQPEHLACLCGALNTLGRRVADLGLRLAVHPHVGTPLETPEEVARAMEGTDPAVVRLCLDTGHTVYGGGDPVAEARRYAERIVYVHAKDIDGEALADARRRGLGFVDGLRRGVFAPLYGAEGGLVDIAAVGRTLAGAGFEGWVVLECDRNPRTGDPDAEAAGARERLAAAFRPAA